MPEIRPCGATIATDGFARGVTLSIDDRYCLDGKKLVAIRGEYGLDGTEYRTEEDSFARIVSFRDALSPDPTSFRVWTKDGRILNFGGPAHTARILAGRAEARGLNGELNPRGERVVAWAVESISDRAGNRVAFIHRQTLESVPGQGIEYWLEQIGYVRRDEDDRAQRRTIRFEYDEERADRSVSFMAGMRLNRHRRLREIVTSVGSTDIARYRLEYLTSAKTGRSLLSAVRQCDRLGLCLSAKRFTYDTNLFVRPAWATTEAPAPDRSPLGLGLVDRTVVGDFDGDGRDDIAYAVPTGQPFTSELRVRHGTPTTVSAPTTMSTPFRVADLERARAVDLDNDGRTELLAFASEARPGTSGASYQLLRPGGSSFEPFGPLFDGQLLTDGSARGVIDFGDVDGDGLVDVFHALTPSFGGGQLHRNSSAGLVSPPLSLGPVCLDTSLQAALDFNGDARAEWLTPLCGGAEAAHALGLEVRGGGVVTYRDEVNLNAQDRDFVFMDVNGDGLKDRVSVSPQPAEDGQLTLPIRWNTGDGFLGTSLLPLDHGEMLTADRSLGPGRDRGIRVADIDGDGRDDLVKFSSGRDGFAREVRVFLSRGDHFESYQPASDPGDTTTDGWGRTQLGDFDGDGMTDIYTVSAADGGPGKSVVSLNTNLGPDLLGEVADARIDPDKRRGSELISYLDERSSDWGATQHALEIPYQYPQRCVKRGIHVVRRWGRWNGSTVTGSSEAFNYTSYEYADARTDLLGRGFLGFAEQVVRDEARGSVTTIHFDNSERRGTAYPFAGRPSSRDEVVSAAGVSRTTRTRSSYEYRSLQGGRTFAVFPTVETTQEVEGTSSVPIRDDRIEQTWDEYGNEIVHVERTLNGTYARAETEMVRDAAYLGEWLVSLPSRTRDWAGETSASPALTPRTWTYRWNLAGQLVESVREPDDASLRLTTSYRYSGGALLGLRASTRDTPDREVSIDYDDDEVHPRRVTNAKGHVSWVRYHSGLDVPLIKVDPNGVRTIFKYDGFGRVRSELGDDGHGATTDYAPATTLAADTEVRVVPRGGAPITTELDTLGRPLLQHTPSFDGRVASTRTYYDRFGRAVRRTRPGFGVYPEDPSPHATTMTYDALDRLLTVREPDGATTTFSYDRMTTRTTDPLGTVVVTTADPNGRVIERRETSGQERRTTFRYGPFGRLTDVEHGFQAPSRFTYDLLGRMTTARGPDVRVRSFAYNAFGEVTTETDADGRTVRFERDVLGRIRARNDASGRTVYGYDQGPGALGKLSSSETPEGVITAEDYDAAGRPARSTTMLEGTAYIREHSYDEFGRLVRLRTPVLGELFELEYVYRANGYLEQVRGADGTPYHTIESRNADGSLWRSRAGNGLVRESLYDARTGRATNHRLLLGTTVLSDIAYAFDSRGLTTSRADAVARVSEAFQYDGAERLTRHDRTGPRTFGSGTQTTRTDYVYDARSNITLVRRDGITAETNEYESGTHLLTATTGPGIINRRTTFRYDQSGRQTRRDGGPGGLDDREVSYSSFDLPVEVEVGSTTTLLRYNAFGERVLKSERNRGWGRRDVLGRNSIVSIGNDYELRIDGVGASRRTQVVYVAGEDGTVAQVELDHRGVKQSTRYFHRDTLGSVMASTTRSDGTVDGRFFYSPFGERLNAAGDSATRVLEQTNVRRGFTGHDHDDELGLINMRGRVYDPVQRRFLTPDPVFAAEAYPAGDGAHAIGASGLARAARVGAVNEATGGVGGVLVGGSDASGFQPTTIASAGSARAPSFRPAGAVPVAGAVANRHGGRSHVFDRYNSYSYVKNSPLKYVDPSGFDPVGVDLDGVEYVVVRGNVQAPPTSFEQALMDIDDTGAFRGAHSFLTGMLASMPLFVGVGGPSIGDVAMAAGVADRSSAIAYYAGMLATGLVMSGRGAPAAVGEEVAGAGVGRAAPFNPSGSMTNCVNSVCAFLNSVKNGSLETASADVAENLGSVRTTNSQIAAQTGVRFGLPQQNSLLTGNARQFYVVYPGSNPTTASHVMIGINNGGRTMLYDPQIGAKIFNPGSYGPFIAFPVAF